MGKSLPARAASVFAVFALIVGFAIPHSSHAARYHVSIGGTRTSGPSNPGVWTPDNCYATIESACLNASAQDSVLLSLNTHLLDSLVPLPGFLGNRSIQDTANGATLILDNEGGFQCQGGADRVDIMGLQFVGQQTTSHISAVKITNALGQLATVHIQHCDFSYLQGSNFDLDGLAAGGALKIVGKGMGTQVFLENCVFVHNSARGPGGAVGIGDGYHVEIQGCTFVGNTSSGGWQGWVGSGGALAVISNLQKTTVLITDSSFSGNSANGPGGGLITVDSSLEMSESAVVGNRSAENGLTPWAAGAGLFCIGQGGHGQDLDFVLDDCLFSENRGNLTMGTHASDGGGALVKAIEGQLFHVQVRDCKFQDNFNGQGAGLYVGRFAVGTVERCSFLNNTAYNNGGAMYKGGAFVENLGELITVSYTEFVGNRAGLDEWDNPHHSSSRGGAFCTRLYPRAHFINCTFLDNATRSTNAQGDALFMASDGGVFDDDQKKCRVTNCLFYSEAGEDVQIRMASGGFDHVSHSAWTEGQFQVPGVETLNTVSLVDNPCQSLSNSVLPEDSPCVDAGIHTGILWDLQHLVVPQGPATDIGALEFPDGVTPVGDETGVLPAPPLTLRCWPNPFNPTGWVEVKMEQAGYLLAQVLNLRGQVVTRIHSGWRPSGHHLFRWNGKGQDGLSLASGVYFIDVQIGGVRKAVPITLVK